jgi:AcrR family transcriptional regulator
VNRAASYRRTANGERRTANGERRTASDERRAASPGDYVALMARTDIARRRGELLDATIALVVERGFGSVRLEDVARRVGVSAPLLVYHFGSKDELMAEAFARAGAVERDRIVAAADSRGAPARRLARLLRLYLGTDAVASWPLWIDAWGTALRSSPMSNVSAALNVEWSAAFEQVIADGKAKQAFAVDDVPETAWRITALLDGFGVEVTLEPHRLRARSVWVKRFVAEQVGISARDLRT